MKNNKTVLILILVIAFVARFISINQSLWLDEAIQVSAVSANSLKSLLFDYFPGEVHPPLSYIVSWVFIRLFGSSEIALRLPSVIFGVINVWLIYLLANIIVRAFPDNYQGKLRTKKVHSSLITHQSSIAELSALLFAIAPLHVYYSQETRPYALACLLAAWSMYEFFKILTTEGKTSGGNKKAPGVNIYCRYILATILMLYSHYVVWLIFPAQVLAVWFLKDTPLQRSILVRLKNFGRFLFSWLIIGFFLIPWLPTLFKQLQAGRVVGSALPSWSNLGALTLKSFALVPVKFLIGRISIENNLIYILALAPILLFTGFLLLKTIKIAISHKPLAIRFLWLWLSVPIVLAGLISLKVPVFQYHRFLFVLPAFYLLLSRGASLLPEKLRLAAFAGFFLVNIVSTGIYLFNPVYHREDWRLAVDFVHKKDMASAVVILEPINAPFKYYDKEELDLYDYSLVDKLRFEKRLWLVKYGQPIFEPDNKTERKIKSYGFEELLKRHFRGVTVKYFINPV